MLIYSKNDEGGFLQINCNFLEKISISEVYLLNAMNFIETALQERKIFLPKDCNTLNVVFVSEDKIKNLNSQFRGKNKVTDILSFEAAEEGSLGDLALCVRKIETQALEHKLSLEEEVFYLILHGILHLLGYDHEKDKNKAEIMYKIQDDIFANWQDSSFNK